MLKEVICFWNTQSVSFSFSRSGQYVLRCFIKHERQFLYRDLAGDLAGRL
jgi:hypothetical protein